MAHLIEYFEESNLIGAGSTFMLLPDFGSHSLKNAVLETKDVVKFTDICTRFQISENYSHGFLVGKLKQFRILDI